MLIREKFQLDEVRKVEDEKTGRPDALAFDLYPDTHDFSICKVADVPLTFNFDFRSAVDLSLIGLELLSRSCRPPTTDPKRFKTVPLSPKSLQF